MDTRILKTRRKFVKNTNIEIAIGQKETIFDEAFSGSVRELILHLDWHNSAEEPEDGGIITITIDGGEVIDEKLKDLYAYFAGGKVGLKDSAVQFVEYDKTTEKRFGLRIELQSLVKTGVKVEVSSLVSTYVCSVKAGLIYDR